VHTHLTQILKNPEQILSEKSKNHATQVELAKRKVEPAKPKLELTMTHLGKP
jgi:hypothetical protein